MLQLPLSHRYFRRCLQLVLPFHQLRPNESALTPVSDRHRRAVKRVISAAIWAGLTLLVFSIIFGLAYGAPVMVVRINWCTCQDPAVRQEAAQRIDNSGRCRGRDRRSSTSSPSPLD